MLSRALGACSLVVSGGFRAVVSAATNLSMSDTELGLGARSAAAATFLLSPIVLAIVMMASSSSAFLLARLASS